jgi:hypothetical protein
MRRMIVVSLALVVTVAVAGTARADGLGDASKRAKAKRDDAKKAEPAPVFTNNSILAESEEKERPTRGTFSAPSGQPPATTPRGPGNPWVPGKGVPGDPRRPYVPEVNVSSGGGSRSAPPEADPDAQKRALAAEYKRQLAGIDARIERAEAEMEEAAEEAEHVVGGTSRDRYARAYAEARKAWAERRAIEDAARRHNIPPGWIR